MAWTRTYRICEFEEVAEVEGDLIVSVEAPEAIPVINKALAQVGEILREALHTIQEEARQREEEQALPF